jgi:hypothetical protein
MWYRAFAAMITYTESDKRASGSIRAYCGFLYISGTFALDQERLSRRCGIRKISFLFLAGGYRYRTLIIC